MFVSPIAVLAVAGTALTSYTPNQKLLGQAAPRYPIPGDTPWRNCVDPTDHLYQIDHAGMDPNPCMVYVDIFCLPKVAFHEDSEEYQANLSVSGLIKGAVKPYARSTSPEPSQRTSPTPPYHGTLLHTSMTDA